MNSGIIISGFGGQGVMVMGSLIAYSGMIENKKVSWMPSYGPEMRGGTAYCAVVVSDNKIGSPLVTEADVVIAMNKPSLVKFEPMLKPGGYLFVNESLIDSEPTRTDINIIKVPCLELADKIGSSKTANMVMLGAFLKTTGIINKEAVVKSMKKAFSARHHDLLPINEAALDEGAKCVQ